MRDNYIRRRWSCITRTVCRNITSDESGADKWLYVDPVYPEIFPSWCFLKRSGSRDSSTQISSISGLFGTIKSQVLSPHPLPCQTQVTIRGTWNPTTTSCSQLFLDSQGHFHYNPSVKKQGLITKILKCHVWSPTPKSCVAWVSRMDLFGRVRWDLRGLLLSHVKRG